MTTTTAFSSVNELDTALRTREVLDAATRVAKALDEKTVLKGADLDVLLQYIQQVQKQRFFPVLHYGVVPWWVGRVAHGRFVAKQKLLGVVVGPNSSTVEKMALR